MPSSASPRRSWLIVPTVGLLFALLIGSMTQLRISILHSDPWTPWDVYTDALARWLGYAALAPLVGFLVFRHPLQRGVFWRRLPLHLAAGLVFLALHVLIMEAAYGLLHMLTPKASLASWYERLFLTGGPATFITYLGISGAYHVIRYHREMVAREQLAASLRARLAEARLEGLRAQLNPHFLFNTLNAISALALTGDREKVVQTLSDLSDLLRVSFDSELPQEIPLARELAILERYLEIQRTRFGERLTVEIDVPCGARGALLPSMVLQPLVENALQHGVSAHPGPGRVVVRAHQAGETLSLRVENTGPGFGAPGLTRAHHGNGNGNGNGHGGVGLSNTRARLEELYGSRQGLQWGDLEGGGAFVEVRVPFRCDSAPA